MILKPASTGSAQRDLAVRAIYSDRNLLTYHRATEADWLEDFAQTMVDQSLDVLGANGTLAISNGQTWHKIAHPSVSLTASTVYTCVWVWKYGTSNNARLVVQKNSDNNEQIINFEGIGETSFGQAGSWGGTRTFAYPDCFVTVAKFTPNTTGDHELEIGPKSATAGESLVAFLGGVFDDGGDLYDDMIAAPALFTKDDTLIGARDHADNLATDSGVFSSTGSMVNQNTTTTDLSESVLGNAGVSLAAINGTWNRVNFYDTAGDFVSGDTLSCVLVFNFGTSGALRITNQARDTGGDLTSILTLTEAGTVFNEINTSAGLFTDYELDTSPSGYNVLTFKFTFSNPTEPDETYRLGVGPNSATAGEDVKVYSVGLFDDNGRNVTRYQEI